MHACFIILWAWVVIVSYIVADLGMLFTESHQREETRATGKHGLIRVWVNDIHEGFDKNLFPTVEKKSTAFRTTWGWEMTDSPVNCFIAVFFLK